MWLEIITVTARSEMSLRTASLSGSLPGGEVNSTVAAVIGVGDSAGLLQVITENEGASLLTFFFFAMVFVVLTLPIGLWTTSLSRKLSVKR